MAPQLLQFKLLHFVSTIDPISKNKIQRSQVGQQYFQLPEILQSSSNSASILHSFVQENLEIDPYHEWLGIPSAPLRNSSFCQQTRLPCGEQHTNECTIHKIFTYDQTDALLLGTKSGNALDSSFVQWTPVPYNVPSIHGGQHKCGTDAHMQNSVSNVNSRNQRQYPASRKCHFFAFETERSDRNHIMKIQLIGILQQFNKIFTTRPVLTDQTCEIKQNNVWNLWIAAYSNNT